MSKSKQLIQFDWAIKKMLRHKANFDILEGFLSELLSQSIKIKQILDSESNKETNNDKFNRVDILVENSNGELLIVEVQNSMEYDYFHRILYGTSKAIAEHIKEREPYANVKKVISITIAYFDLGHGKDYVYHGTTNFKGIHKGDILHLSNRQKELYSKEKPNQVFPEYWLIKVGKFDDRIKDKLDEWIYFLKNGAVLDNFTAQGLAQAKDKLDEMKMTEPERKAYRQYLKHLHDLASEQHTKMADVAELLAKAEAKAKAQGEEIGKAEGKAEGEAKGKAEGKAEIARKMKGRGMSNKDISDFTGLTAEEIEKL